MSLTRTSTASPESPYVDPAAATYDSSGIPYWASTATGVGLSGFGRWLLNAAADSWKYELGSWCRWLLVGSVIEAGRRLSRWAMARVPFHFTKTALFLQGDPSYDWVMLFLAQQKVWKRTKDYNISSAVNQLQHGLAPGSEETVYENADYVPAALDPQLFKWKGHWIDVVKTSHNVTSKFGNYVQVGCLMTFYTTRRSVMQDLIEEAHRRYVELSKPIVRIFIADMPPGLPTPWTTVKRKLRRPIDSVVLREGVMETLASDVKNFIASEEWYVSAGIPHRRGYLLYGPPGTGKTSTIYTIAGELGLDVYTLSLATPYVDDAFLERAMSSIAKRSILLIEDIDCAFPSREDAEDEEQRVLEQLSSGNSAAPPRRRANVTMSGLLNAIDGIGSEEGRIFFATTNYVDRLDDALMRPGRLDRKIEYTLATQEQASALFRRFFPVSHFGVSGSKKDPRAPTKTIPKASSYHSEPKSPSLRHEYQAEELDVMAKEFSVFIPEEEFSVADLQGYLLSCRTSPQDALTGIATWVEDERAQRRAKKEREEARKEKIREAIAKGKATFILPPPLPPHMRSPLTPLHLITPLPPSPPLLPVVRV